MLRKIIIGLVLGYALGHFLGGLMPLQWLIVGAIVWSVVSFWGMYTAKRDLNAYRNGELIIDSATGRAVPNPAHPRYRKEKHESGAAAAAAMAGAASTGAFAFAGDEMDSDAPGFSSPDTSGFDDLTSPLHDDFQTESAHSTMDDMAINPANGMPMVGGMGGVDVEGNPYGTDISDLSGDHDPFSDSAACGLDDSFTTFDDDFGCGIDDSMGSGFDDW